MDNFFIFGAKYAVILSIALWAWYLYTLRKDRRGLLISGGILLVSLVLTYGIGSILRHFYYNPRPFIVEGFTPLIPHVPDNGFPSDHTLLAAGLAAVALMYNRKLSMYLWIITIFVACSRVYVGVHHPIDVIGSIIIALIATGIVYLVLKTRLGAIIAKSN